MSTDLYGIRVLDVRPEECRVRLRVLVIYHDHRNVDGRSVLTGYVSLPRDASFFLGVLHGVEVDGRHVHTPVREAVHVDHLLDPAWLERNLFRFVERVEQLAVRNDPPRAQYWAYLESFDYADRGYWEETERRPQADYDVWVTEPRWLDQIREGQTWGTPMFDQSDRYPGWTNVEPP